MTGFEAQFTENAPRRWHYTSGPANGEYATIRMCGLDVLTGIDTVATPATPTLGGLRLQEPGRGGGIVG